jgi:hypothetical protein
MNQPRVRKSVYRIEQCYLLTTITYAFTAWLNGNTTCLARPA